LDYWAINNYYKYLIFSKYIMGTLVASNIAGKLLGDGVKQGVSSIAGGVGQGSGKLIGSLFGKKAGKIGGRIGKRIGKGVSKIFGFQDGGVVGSKTRMRPAVVAMKKGGRVKKGKSKK
jgi:hypothetical protein